MIIFDSLILAELSKVDRHESTSPTRTLSCTMAHRPVWFVHVRTCIGPEQRTAGQGIPSCAGRGLAA